MWKLLFVLALPLAPMAAAHTVASEESADVHCQIRAKPMSGGIELEAIVASATPLSGTYQFDVRKAGHVPAPPVPPRAATSRRSRAKRWSAMSASASSPAPPMTPHWWCAGTTTKPNAPQPARGREVECCN
jgi:hypothetical protein